MDDELLERLLREGESTTWDYKRDQYQFYGNVDDRKKSDLLKDILSFANAWRRADAYILIGIDDCPGGRRAVVGVTDHLKDNDVQQFVNSKTNRPVTFSCTTYRFEGKEIDVICIPEQDRPLYAKKDFGGVKSGEVYYRQGSTNAVATPDEIAKMGVSLDRRKAADRGTPAPPRQEVVPQLGFDPALGLTVQLYNNGSVDVFIKEVCLEFRIDPKTTGELPLVVVNKSVALRPAGHAVSGSREHDLGMRRAVAYVLPRVPVPMLENLISQASSHVWIVVRHFGGEVCRVPENEVLPVLSVALEAWKAEEQQNQTRQLFVDFSTTVDGTETEIGFGRLRLSTMGDGRKWATFDDVQPTHSLSQRVLQHVALQVGMNVVTGTVEGVRWRLRD